MPDLPDSVMEIQVNAAERCRDNSLKAQLVHQLGEAKPGEQED